MLMGRRKAALLAVRPRFLPGAPQQSGKPQFGVFSVEWFRNEVIGACPESCESSFAVVTRAQQNDRDGTRRLVLSKTSTKSETVQAAQFSFCENKGGRRFLDHLERMGAVTRRDRLEPKLSQDRLQLSENIAARIGH
jgi:hypothetical protein